MASDGKYGKFSVKEAYVYPLSTDDTTSGLTYGNGKQVIGMQTISFSRNRTQEPLPGDDTVLEVESSLDSLDITVEHGKINHEALAIIEGGTVLTDGVSPNDTSEYVLYGDSQPSGYFKLVARCAKIGKTGADVLLTFYKVNAATIEGGLENKAWGKNSFTAQAIKTSTTGVTTDTDDRIFSEKERNSGVAGAISATSDSTAPTISSTTPADAATGVSVSANQTITFSELMDLSTLSPYNIELMKQDGTPVALTQSDLSYNSGTHVLTINPPSNLSASTDYILTVSTNVKDAAGNRLAARKVVNFQTA